MLYTLNSQTNKSGGYQCTHGRNKRRHHKTKFELI